MAGSVDKIRTLIQKASDQIITACDTLDSAIVEATGVGGKLASIIPPHLQSQIDKLTAIVKSEDASSLLKLDDLILNMPYRDLAPQKPSTSEKLAASGPSGVNTTPNTAGGPKTAVQESILNEYRREAKANQIKGGLNFDSLKESYMGGQAGAGSEFGDLAPFKIGAQQPIDKFSYRQKIRETVDNDNFEDLDQELQESMDGQGHFNWKAMRGVGGSLDNLSFATLKDSASVSDTLIQ